MEKPEKVNQMIDRMLIQIVEKYHPIKVILFGSYVTGNYTEDSDIDLLLIKDTDERFIDRWCNVGTILAGTHPSIPVDTLILTPHEIESRLSKGDQFITEILAKGILLYAA